MEEISKAKQTPSARAGKKDQDSGKAASPADEVAFYNFPTFQIVFYWILFGQLVLLWLSLFGYDSLRPVIDRVSSIIPAVESLRHSTRVMNTDLARAYYALMWLCSPVLIIAALFTPVRPGESIEYLGVQSQSKAVSLAFLCLLLGILLIYIPPDGGRTLGLESFAIGFAFLSSFFHLSSHCRFGA